MTNSSNSAHGKKFQKWLHDELLVLAFSGKLKAIMSNFGARHPGYSCPDQYYVPILITLKTDEQWAIFTTTSCRTDRLKGQQWDAEHLKMFCPSIKRAILVYPDEIDLNDKKLFIAQRTKYENHWEYSCIDTIVSVSELEKEIDNV